MRGARLASRFPHAVRNAVVSFEGESERGVRVLVGLVSGHVTRQQRLRLLGSVELVAEARREGQPRADLHWSCTKKNAAGAAEGAVHRAGALKLLVGPAGNPPRHRRTQVARRGGQVGHGPLIGAAVLE